MTQTGTATTARKATSTSALKTLPARYRVSAVTGKEYRAHGDGTADKRGNLRDRAARKVWLLSAASGFGGNGETVRCFYCPRVLTTATVQADRIDATGSYRRTNIRPACAGCNNAKRAAGNPIGWTGKRQAA